MRLDTLSDRVFGALMLVASLMPYVPELSSPLSLLFSAVFGVLLFVAFARVALQPSSGHVGGLEVALLLFLVAGVLSLPVALGNEITLGAWARGAVPFVFLVVFYVIAPVRDAARRQYLLNVLHLASVFWLVKIMVISFLGIGQLLGGQISRLTFLTLDLTLPYSLVGLVLSLFNPDPRVARWRMPLSAAFLLIIFLSGYRSQLLIAALVLLVFLYRMPAKVRIMWMVLIAGVVAFALVSITQTAFWRDYTTRFVAVSSFYEEDSRMQELRFALGEFAESPILGNGFGNPVPAEVVFGGDVAFVTSEVGKNTVSYIHNVGAYLLMDVGLLGFLAYFSFIGLAVARALRAVRAGSPDSQVRFSAVVGIGALLTFFLIAASFRQIQSNLMVATLVAVAGSAQASLGMRRGVGA